MPTDHYGETKMTFDYYSKTKKHTIRKGRKINKFTKFKPNKKWYVFVTNLRI